MNMKKKNEYKLPVEEYAAMVNEPQRSWGGPWTEEKLDAFEKYVKAYLTIMKKYAIDNGWDLFYFDAFAGSGSRESDIQDNNDVEDTIKGILSVVPVTSLKAYITLSNGTRLAVCAPTAI